MPWLSAYAMLAVDGAVRAGMFVPKDAEDRGVAYLRQVLDQSVPAADDDAKAEDPGGRPGRRRPAKPAMDPKEKRARAYAELTFVADALAS